MLVLSLLIIVSSGVFFIFNGMVPFEKPISMLHQGRFPLSYHIILMLFGTTLTFVALRAYKEIRIHDLIYSCLILVCVVLLLFIPVGYTGHNELAVITMLLTGMMSVGIAKRCDHGLLFWLAVGEFFSMTLIFSQKLLVMGIVEGFIMSVSLLILNINHYKLIPETYHNSKTSFLSQLEDFLQSSHPGASMTWWKPGMGAGIMWAMVCLFMTKMSGLFGNNYAHINGPIIAIVSSLAAYSVVRYEFGLILRIITLFGSFIVTLITLQGMNYMHIRFDAMIALMFFLPALFVAFFVYDLHSE